MNVDVSVIIPTYNRATTLTRAIDSILQQTVQLTEIIVIDDGSTDHTKETLNQYENKITLIEQSNQGVSSARNTGIKAAQSTWIALLDSDDAWHPDKLNAQVQALQDNPSYLICHTDEIWYRHNKRVNQMKKHQKRGGDIFNQSLSLCAISPSSVLLHTKLLTEIGLFDESLPACEDYDLWLRITAHYPTLYIDQALTIKYGGHEDQLSKKYWGMDRFRIQTLLKIINSNTLSNEKRHAATHMLCKKVKVYLSGAIKRNKQKDIEYYTRILNQYL